MTDHRRAAWLLALSALIAAAVFALWPELDLRVSALFWRPGEGFFLRDQPILGALRYLAWGASLVLFLLSVVVAAITRCQDMLRRAAFVALLYLTGPILLVDMLLKRFWGRARPAQVTEFGGPADFTPFWLPSDQCARNCSFVSGEGSAAVALILAALVLVPVLRRWLPRRAVAGIVLATGALSVLTLAQRVATGRHFLSDTVFATLLVLAIGLVLHRLLLARRGRGGPPDDAPADG
ncbi:phosphatase PAP2 family protein [Albidovulum sp.]